MLKDLRIENGCLKFTDERGYYDLELSAIDVVSKEFTNVMFSMSNGKLVFKYIDDKIEEFDEIKDILATDPRFLTVRDNTIINLDDLKRYYTKIETDKDYLYGWYCLVLEFGQKQQGVYSKSKEECELMKSMIDEAMKSRIEEYQESITKHDTSVESNL